MPEVSGSKVRVRFAPSPTGSLHVGGARTALFNWLFARHHGGTFVLRIEDTDRERSTPESERSMIEDLRWLGLDWDEGPDVGGPHGPYRQSERLEIYREAAERLANEGRAYPCFCSDEELERKRREALEAGRPPQYDGTCRRMDPDEARRRREAGEPHVIRFVVPPGEVRFRDRVRGWVSLPHDMVGDFVLLRSNGMPTYNFAAVVDDGAMGITHVIRGEEHLSNTLRQILLYRALGMEPPEFAHVPLILAPDRSKLSKRHGGSSVGALREAGYLPEAVVNYLALLGWSPASGEEVLDRESLVREFDLDRVSRSPSVFDLGKLDWLGGVHLRRASIETLWPEAEPFFPEDFREAYPEAARREAFELVRDGLAKLSDLPSALAPFRHPPRFDGEASEVLRAPGSREVVRAFREALNAMEEPLEAAAVKETIKRVGRELGKKGKDLYFPVRAAVTGSVHGPDLARVVAIKGKDRVLAELEAVLAGEVPPGGTGS
jgi:glutamyl-tRNA synthetase